MSVPGGVYRATPDPKDDLLGRHVDSRGPGQDKQKAEDPALCPGMRLHRSSSEHNRQKPWLPSPHCKEEVNFKSQGFSLAVEVDSFNPST